MRSTLGARKAENKAWSEGNFDATHEVDYPADAPADYTVEPTAEADLHNSGALVQRRSFKYGGGYPVRSTIGARKAENKAWNDGNIDATHEPHYQADSPADYTVEPTAEADLHNGGLFQRRRMTYPVKDSHSYINPYTHSDHAWSNEQHAHSDEVKWVEQTRTLHSDTLEHMDLIDGRTGTPSTTANTTTASDTTATDTTAPALFQRRRHNPYLDFSQIYRVTDSNSYLKPYEQRDHSWNDYQYDVADEVAWLGNTKTLHADYLENLDPTAEYHLTGGRTGVAETDDE